MACQSASSGILPTTQGKQAVEKPAELALLLSEQPRHAKTPTLHPRAPRTHVNGNGILTLMRVHRRSILLLPVGEPVQQRVQHGDPSIAYLRHVVAGGRGRLLRHSVGEGQVAQIAEHVDRPRGGEYKSGVLSISRWAPPFNSSWPRVAASGLDQITSSV